MSAQSNIKNYIAAIDAKLAAMPDNQLLQFGKQLLDDRKRAAEALIDKTGVSFDVLQRFLGVVNRKIDGMPANQMFKYGAELVDTRADLLEALEAGSGVTLQSIANMDNGQTVVNIADTIIPIIVKDGAWLIGRGREGWAWDNKGKGSPLDLLNTKNPSAFNPAYYSANTINTALTVSGLDLDECEVILRRAHSADGSYFYDTILNFDASLWSWDFPSTSPYIYLNYYEVIDPQAGISGRYEKTSANEFPIRDYFNQSGTFNTQYRWYTLPYVYHDYQAGFMGGAYQVELPDGSYPTTGSRYNNWGSRDPENFGFRGEIGYHTIPYTEVYLRVKRDQEEVD